MKCSGVKTAKNSQREGGDERIKHENVNVPEAILPLEKPEECTVKKLQKWLLCSGAKTTGKKMQLVPQAAQT